MNHTRTQRYLPLRLRVFRTALLLTLVLAAALGGPSRALADRQGSDTVGGVPLSAGEITTTLAPDVRFKAGLLLATDGRMLWGRDPQTSRPMASITKMMTALLTLERGDLDDDVTISKAASEVEDATGLLPGETFTVRELLELALVTSSNDAAYALAEHTGTTLPAFVAQMNAKAGSLGLRHTHYANPHGLDAPGHYSSPADIASLSRTAMQSAEFRRIVMLPSVTLPAYGTRKAKTLESTNELLGTYRGMQGVKTGFTNDAKHSFVASAKRGGVTLTAVVLGAETNSARFAQCARLLDWGFAHFSLQTVTTTTETVGTVPLSANTAKSVTARYEETTSVPVFDLDGAVTATTTLSTEIALPVFEGQRLGEAIIVQGQRELARVAVVAAASAASAEETVGAVPVADYIDRTVSARASGEPLSVAEFDPKVAVDRRVTLDTKVQAPVAVGRRIGEIVYSQRGTVIVRVPVVASAAVMEPDLVAKAGIWFARGWRALTGQPTIAKRIVLEG